MSITVTDVTRVLQMMEVSRNASRFADTIEYVMFTSDAAQDRTCTARAVVRSGHRTTARAVKKN